MKYRIKKWYTVYDGSFEVEAKDEAEALVKGREWIGEDGMDPDEFHLEAETLEEPHEMFKREDEWEIYKGDTECP